MKYIVEIILLIAFAWCVCSYLSSDPNGIWFSRSGSIMVFFSVIAEFIISNRRETSSETKSEMKIGADVRIIRTLCKRDGALETLSVLGIIIGTVIWGYGDWIYIKIAC